MDVVYRNHMGFATRNHFEAKRRVLMFYVITADPFRGPAKLQARLHPRALLNRRAPNVLAARVPASGLPLDCWRVDMMGAR